MQRYRDRLMGGAAFEIFDVDKNGNLDASDFAARQKFMLTLLMNKTRQRDDDWIWDNYFNITSSWLLEHFALEPNKTRLLKLDLPIYIFHGTDDAHVTVEGVHDLKRRFEVAGKDNLQAFLFEKHDHDLNFTDWVRNKELSEGFQQVFDIASSLAKDQ